MTDDKNNDANDLKQNDVDITEAKTEKDDSAFLESKNGSDKKEKVCTKKGFRYGCYLFFKRTFDIIFSSIFLIAFSWLILICLLIKFLEDFHNPIYVSNRTGKTGKNLNSIK